TVDIPPTRTRSLRVEITGTLGIGDNAVGFWGVDVPGVRVTKVARLPRTLTDLFPKLGASGRSLLATAPLDIVLSRQLGEPLSSFDDEERRLDRQFELPQGRLFGFLAQARPAPELSESVIDALAGADPRVVAT